MICTVNGLFDKEELGITMCHEHLALDLSLVRGDDDSTFHDRNLIVEELNKMKAYGVKTVVEVTCGDMGRDVRALREISDVCDIHIIAATGCYLEAYHNEFIRYAKAEDICDIFEKEAVEGIGETGIKAGIIGEVASGMGEMAPSEERVLIAAAMASVRTGLAVTTHCQMGSLALEQSKILQENGMNPDKIILGHLDLANNRDYYVKVLSTGVNIGFDTIGKSAYLSDEIRADNLLWLLEKGYEDHIVLSQDISRKSYLSAYGNYSGYMTVMKDFVPLLKKKGIKEEDLEKLLIRNPARILDI
ncbi:phosphotriesterase family protein [Kineothrix sp. MB12-C1]|uniref:phosphotriesterase family protein n=1 Tax=Kineothrix sp. MB12-C1 TaxID=3070215 RepID=UPI0027D2E352|nr:phosphotriesterase-related protein [Kineothrix sp. MB12-C1]WMC91339.1 TatD family hydrolase [Kineothrix sp. MB12-C1]